MLGAYKGITSPFKQKRDYLDKRFADPDEDVMDGDASEDPHPAHTPANPASSSESRVARTMGGDAGQNT